MMHEKIMKKTIQASLVITAFLFSLIFTPVKVDAAPEYLYLTVTGDSMAPSITEGARVKVKVCVDGDLINVGDIIVYCTIATMAYTPVPKGMWIGHRVVKKYQRDGKWYFRTKGDAAPEPDPWEVPEHFLLGVVVGITNASVQDNASDYSAWNVDYSAVYDFFLGLVIGIFLGLFANKHGNYSLKSFGSYARGICVAVEPQSHTLKSSAVPSKNP